MLLLERFWQRRPRAPGTASSTSPAYPLHPAHEVTEPTGPAGGDLEGSEYPAPLVAANKITEGKLAAAVRAKLLGPASVITEYLQAGAVTLSALSAAVQARLLAAGAVITEYLANEAVTEAKLAAAVQTKLNEKGGGAELAWVNVEGLNAHLEIPGGATSTRMLCALGSDGQVYLAGNLKVITAEIKAGETLFTLPAAMHPSKERSIDAALQTLTGAVPVFYKVATTGVVTCSVAISIGERLRFDSLMFPKVATGE